MYFCVPIQGGNSAGQQGLVTYFEMEVVVERDSPRLWGQVGALFALDWHEVQCS